jgi:type II secretory pathway component PulF
MTNTVLAAVQAAQATLGIASPSKVFEQLGQYTGQGMAGGMNAMQPAVASAGAGLGIGVGVLVSAILLPMYALTDAIK